MMEMLLIGSLFGYIIGGFLVKNLIESYREYLYCFLNLSLNIFSVYFKSNIYRLSKDYSILLSTLI